jgi:hypothetical protein
LRYRFFAMGTPRQLSDANEPASAPAASEPPPAEVAPAAISFDSPEALRNAFSSLSHDALFASAETANDACDVCGEKVADEDDEDGYSMSGRGLYIWTRGDETRREEPPLCPACAAALGLSALARWEIDEEEG